MTILHELKKWQDLCLIGLIYSTPPPCLGLKKKLGADFFFFFRVPPWAIRKYIFSVR